MLLNIGLIVAGFVVLVFGADWLVKGASRMALSLGMTPLVVGLTVVAFGTSAPELAVSVASAWSGQADLAVGNVVGSNIANVLLILGISALVAPLVVNQQLVRLDVPIMLGATVLFYVLSLDGRINLWDSILLAGGIVAYVVFLIRESRREKVRWCWPSTRRRWSPAVRWAVTFCGWWPVWLVWLPAPSCLLRVRYHWHAISASVS